METLKANYKRHEVPQELAQGLDTGMERFSGGSGFRLSGLES